MEKGKRGGESLGRDRRVWIQCLCGSVFYSPARVMWLFFLNLPLYALFNTFLDSNSFLVTHVCTQSSPRGGCAAGVFWHSGML